MVVKITLRPISLQNIDRLYLNFTHMDFEGARTNFRYPLRTISKGNFNEILGGLIKCTFGE